MLMLIYLIDRYIIILYYYCYLFKLKIITGICKLSTIIYTSINIICDCGDR